MDFQRRRAATLFIAPSSSDYYVSLDGLKVAALVEVDGRSPDFDRGPRGRLLRLVLMTYGGQVPAGIRMAMCPALLVENFNSSGTIDYTFANYEYDSTSWTPESPKMACLLASRLARRPRTEIGVRATLRETNMRSPRAVTPRELAWVTDSRLLHLRIWRLGVRRTWHMVSAPPPDS